MHRSATTCLLAASACVALAAVAASSSQQDYLDAVGKTANREQGAQLFSGCAGCHGADGGGSTDGLTPRIAGQHSRVILRQLIDYAYDKRRDPRMEPVAHTRPLQDAQAIADVAGFIAGLRPRTPAGTGQGAYLELGRQAYSARCSTCHGPSGEGDGQSPVPRLAGQHYAYLLRQFHDALEGRRPELAGSHEQLLQDLDRDGLEGLADLLSRSDPAAR